MAVMNVSSWLGMAKAKPCSRMLGNVWGLIQAVNVLHPSAAGAASHKYPASADFVAASHTYLASADFVVVSDECWLSVEFVGASPCSRMLASAGA